jgi:hypothetical protein
VRERLSQNIPELVKELNDQDILAMQMVRYFIKLSYMTSRGDRAEIWVAGRL